MLVNNTLKQTRPNYARKRRIVFVGNVAHYGREFARHSDGCVRAFGPTVKTMAMSAAPALLAAGAHQAATFTTVMGHAADGYSQLRATMPD